MIATDCGSHSAQQEPRTPRQRAPELAGCTWTRIKLVEAMVVLIARLERRWQLSRRRTEREQGSGPRGGLSFARGQRRQAPARASCWCSMGSICLGPNLRRSLKLTEPEGGATAATTFEVRTAW